MVIQMGFQLVGWMVYKKRKVKTQGDDTVHSNHRSHMKKPSMVMHTWNSNAGEAESEVPGAH